jgi:hypothetical protein
MRYQSLRKSALLGPKVSNEDDNQIICDLQIPLPWIMYKDMSEASLLLVLSSY